jgi:hypothetical protein
VVGNYENIPQAAQSEAITTSYKINWIAQEIDQYQKEIEDL